MTNEQKIKAMSTEELAKYIFRLGNGSEYCYGHCIYQDDENCTEHNCLEGVTAWLKQDAASDNGNSSGWISAKDSLPEKDGYYITSSDDGLLILMNFTLLRGWHDMTLMNLRKDKVAYWRRLPSRADTNWIDCKKKMPETNGFYAVINRNGRVTATYHTSLGWGTNWNNLESDDCILFWKPIPEPPKGK